MRSINTPLKLGIIIIRGTFQAPVDYVDQSILEQARLLPVVTVASPSAIRYAAISFCKYYFVLFD